mgnify:CR=1 FL=1
MNIFKLANKFAQQQKTTTHTNALLNIRAILLQAANSKGQDVLKYFHQAIQNMVSPWPLPPNMGLNDTIKKPLIEIATYLGYASNILSKPLTDASKKKALGWIVAARRIMLDYNWPIKNRTTLMATMGRAIGFLSKNQENIVT